MIHLCEVEKTCLVGVDEPNEPGEGVDGFIVIRLCLEISDQSDHCGNAKHSHSSSGMLSRNAMDFLLHSLKTRISQGLK
jgi:hypothetical protein